MLPSSPSASAEPATGCGRAAGSPLRAAIHVCIGTTIVPAGQGWAAALALRDQARAVQALCAEPDVSSHTPTASGPGRRGVTAVSNRHAPVKPSPGTRFAAQP